MTQTSQILIFLSGMLTLGILIGLKADEMRPERIETHIVYLNYPDTLRMRAFHTECWYIQDIWKEGIENPIEADFRERSLP